ncbi:MAG: hypothetical protein JXB60_00135 [Candidatus Cloacimonetes bacterium]|nr:hypothetical protein [Candidatus Cloacimonadota bacterium]
MSNTLFKIAIIFVCWGIVSAIKITSYVAKRGHKVSILFLRIMIYKYIHQYTEITKQETGKIGPWFYHYVISMNLTLIFIIIGIILWY